MEPVFSVIVPIYKVEKYIHKCVDSILSQSYPDFELILVDDGSPDNCPSICDEYAEADERVHVIHKENGGLVSARNVGLKYASGDYVIYVDGDDWIVQETLETLWNKAISDKNPDMIVFNMIRIYEDREDKDPCYVEEGLYEGERLQNEIIPYMMYDYRKSFYHGILFPSCGGKVIKREIMLEHYCKDERIRMGEDNAFIFECLFYSKSVYFLTEYFYMYNHLNEGSIRHNYDAKRFQNNKFLTEYITEHLFGISESVDAQINVFRAYWLIMAVFHEVKCKRPLLKAASHIRQEIKENNSLDGINCRALPKSARMFITLLKVKAYGIAIIGARFINSVRK